MSLLEFFTESKKKQVQMNQVSRSQRVDHESITSQLRANHEPTTRDKGTYRSLFDLVSLSSRSRAIAMIFAVLILSIANIGMAWGATHTVTPNIGGTQYEIYNIYSNSSAYAFFSNATTIRSAYSSWVIGQLSNKSDGGATAPSGWLSTGSGKPGYGKGMVNDTKTVTMTVTNCIEVAFVSKSGGSRTSNLSVKLDGVEVGSVATNGNSYAAVTYGTALDASKTYTITLSGSNSSNCEVDQIRFKAPAVCSAALGGTTSNPSATVGESAGTISCTVNNGAAKTATSYQWYKNTSKSTSGATSISGATSSTYSPNEASAGTYYYYCTVQTAQITTNGADAARITSDISDAFVFTAAPEPSCSTPDAPTATSNGEKTSISQAVSWTDASNEKWDVIVSTSSSTPDAGDTPTASNLTSKSYTFTGLSASTTYYWWVRSVCDATHKSAWYAGDSFTTSALVTYTLTTTVGTSGAATGGATITNGVVASIPSGTTVTNNGDNTFTINTASPTTVTASASVSGVAGPDDDPCTYAFTGWENLPATVTVDVSNIHALYEARFAIGFKETDGTAVAGVSSTYYVYGTGKAVSTFPTPTKSGFTFAGWYTDVALTSPATDLDNEAYGAIDYYAKWEELICSISECGNATLTYPIYTAGNLTTSNLFSGATSSNATAVSVGSSPAFTGVTVSAATKGSSANAGACYAKSTALTGKMQYSASSKSSSYYIDFPFTVNTGYTFTPCDVQVVIQPVSSNQTFTVEITNGTNVYGTSTATLNAGVMEPIIGLTSPAEMSAGNYAVRLYPHGGSSKEFRMGANVILKGTTAAAACSAPTSPAITGSASYNVGAMMNLTASATGTNGSTTYTWYKGATWDAASATTPVQATSTSGATYTIAGCVAEDAGTYWCNISNGTGCDVQVSHAITVSGACTKPGKPALPRVEDGTLTHNSATFSWDRDGATANSDGYVVSIVKVSDGSTVLDWTSTGIYTDGDGYLYNATGLTEETTYYFVVKAIGADGYCEYGDTARVEFSTGAPASLTALECNTLYKVEHMVPASITLSGTGQYAAGLSANTKFEVIGDPSKTDQAGGTPEMKTIDAVTIDGTSFPAAMYLKRAAQITSSLPTSNAVKFIVGASGTLTMYVKRSDRLYLIKEGGSDVSLGSSDKDVKVEKPVTAGTYYIFAKNTSTAVYGIQLNCCSTPDAPTGFTAGSITSTGATFTITDAGDAASYDIYYSTSSDAPTAGTAATTTSTSKTKTVTGLTASTTYYAWVRSVCDADHKSGWVAADPFATPAAVTYDVIYHDHRSVSGDPAPETEKTGSVPATVGYLEGAEVTVAGNTGSLTFSIEGATATFRGWSTSSTGFGGTFYAAGANFNMPASDVDLYAVWSYPIEYNENGGTINDASYPSYYIYIDNESGSETVTATLPTNVTKTGYEFGGWFDNSGCTGSAITTITGDYYGTYVLYAKWTKASDCVTITNFETSQHSSSDGKPDSQTKYIYGYKGTVDEAHAVTITTSNTSNKGQNSNADMLIYYGTSIYIYADNTTTSGTPATFSDVASVSLKVKNKHATKYSTMTIKVGSTTIANAVSLDGANNSTYTTYTYSGLSNLSGKIEIHNGGSGSTDYNFFIDDISICQADDCEDSEVSIAAVNSSVCAGSKIKITSSGYEDGADFQWQKLNGSTWTDIDGATLDSLVIASAAVGNAGSYRLIAHKTCNRTSNTVVIAVPSAPVFGAVTSPRSVMATQTLSISDVEASDATGYKWYQSADATFDAGDTQIGTTKNLTKTYADETIASPSYYLFCVATNSCGADTTSAIAVNVTEIVDEECANRGGEGETAFGFVNTSCSQVTYSSTACWQSGGRAYYLTYSAPTGKYLKVAKVTVAVSSNSKCGYAYSTDNGTNWTYAELTGLSTTLTEKTINLSGLNVTDFRIGRNLQDGSSKDWGITEGKFYLSRACFEYSNACTATTVTPSTSSKDHTIGNSFTEPTFTVKHGNTAFDPQPTITYTSSNEDVATVDDDGTVTFQGKGGIVKITASYAGDETYCASEGYYTINVSCPGGAPMIVAADGTNMSGCNTSVTLLAKQQDGTAFDDGTYQWFRNGTEISGATSSSYTAIQAGVYTVERTNAGGCTTPSTNSATITSEVTEPEVERLTPFQYYHVDSVYPAASIMRYRHLFAVKNSGTKNDKIYQMEMSLNRGALTDVTNSNALVMDADTVLLDLNKLNGKYSEGDTLKFICHAIDCNGNASNTYKDSIYVYVINKTRSTLALILNGKGSVVGGDFFDYEPQNLQQQTGEKTWSGEWSMYTELKEDYIVTPVSGYAQFNKLNYEPFDIVFLTDFPKASKSAAAATVLDDMADLCDFRPLFSFKTHMVAKSPSKWAAKGFTTSPVSDTKNAGKLNLNIVCYAHPMFDAIKSGDDVYTDVENSSAPLVYKMLEEPGYENSKGMQGFEIADAENFVTIGLTHHDATITYNLPYSGDVTWAAGSTDRMLVTVAERQTNIEARMILFSLNAGAHSKLTDKGEQVVLACLRYLLKTDPMAVADCSFTFDNGASNEHDAAWYTEHCNTCTGTKGDHKWTTAANWAPSYNLLPGEFTSVRIEAAAVVDTTHAHVMEIRIKEGGSIEIPVGKALDVKSTIRRLDGSEISPTENSDIYIASEAGGNGTLIFNNNTGDTKAVVAMYTTAKTAEPDPVTGKISAAASTWQYIGTPHSDVVSALHNYYDGWLYQQNASYSGWTAIPNGGPLETFRGYCVTHPQANHTFIMEGTLAATTSQDIDVPAGKYVVMANSWVAPIDIKLLTDNDFENIDDKSVYFFNTGSDPEGTGTVTDESGGISEETRWAANTYVSVPIHAASYTGKDDHIPSMQGFYVVGGSSNGTLHLDYNRHVRKSSRGYVSGRMHAPKRGLVAADGEPEVAKLFFRGNRYDDRLVVLEREDFTEGYDSGWDGEAWGGNDAAPMSYVSIQGRQDAVSAVPEYEGTLIGFRAGEDSEYLINFVYSPENEPLYLYDTETNQYSQVVTGNAYHFTTSDKKTHERFILTRNTPQIATGCEYLNGGEGAKAKKLLIEDKMFILVNGVLYDATGKVVK